MRSPSVRLFAFAVVVGGLGCEVAGCGLGGHDVDLAVSLPNALIEATTWFEVGAFEGASCAAVIPMLPNGVPEGVTARVAFKRTDPAPRFGEIPNGSYAFAAVARDQNCAIVASGCVEEDVDSVDLVSIPMTPSAQPSGACAKGASCQAAKCVPAIDNSDPSVGAGCSLELLGAGPLASAFGRGGVVVSAPAIATTTSGSFIIGYRDIDPNGAGARVTLLPVDSAGGANEARRFALTDACPVSEETDGVGLVMNGESGMMALAKAPCEGRPPELQVLNFTSGLDIGEFIVTQPAEGESVARVTFGAARAAAFRPSGSLVVYTNGAAARVASMDAVDGIVPPSGTFGGRDGNITDAWIAANDTVIALLAVGDASTDSSDEADDPGAAATTLRLQILPANTDVGKLSASTSNPITFPGAWGSLAASRGRVIVFSDGAGPGRSVTYRAFDRDDDRPADTNGFSVEGTGKVTSGDVAIAGNRAYFASLKPGAISLHVYGNATTTLTPLASTLLAREPRISAMNTVRDGRVSVAATATRVAVAWTTAKVLGAYDPAGGYAVFACTE